MTFRYKINTCITMKFEESRRRNHLHLDTELHFNNYLITMDSKLMFPNHLEGVIRKGLPLSMVTVMTKWSCLHNWPSIAS